jgi:hypothetical protein
MASNVLLSPTVNLMADGMIDSSRSRTFFPAEAEGIAQPLSEDQCALILRDQVETARHRFAARQCTAEEFAAALQRLLDLVVDGKVPKDLRAA